MAKIAAHANEKVKTSLVPTMWAAMRMVLRIRTSASWIKSINS